MSDLLVAYTIVFASFFYVLLIPPKEFLTSGLTLDNILSSILGDELDNLVVYQIKRTSLSILFYSLVPTFYFVGYEICLFNDHNPAKNVTFFQLPYNNDLNVFFGIQARIICLVVSIAIFILSLIWVIHASLNKWSNHPIAKNLALYASDVAINNGESNISNTELSQIARSSAGLPRYSWLIVAESINQEFKAIDKFSSNIGNMFFYLTNSWMIKVSTFKVHIVQKNDVHLSLVKAKDHSLSHMSDFGTQILEINVQTIHKQDIKPFIIRLSSLDYSFLREALENPIHIAENIVIKQSMADRFVEAFIGVIENNPIYLVPSSTTLENCLGCLAKMSDVKLRKNCSSDECSTCYCRPMWCKSCMAKWFASRQDQKTPESWLSGRSPCPLCRSIFCILDVCYLQHNPL